MCSLTGGTLTNNVGHYTLKQCAMKFDEEEHTSTVKFDFDGEWFRDRPYELMAVSRLDYRTLKQLESRTDDDDR